jgi:hypothetical protein
LFYDTRALGIHEVNYTNQTIIFFMSSYVNLDQYAGSNSVELSAESANLFIQIPTWEKCLASFNKACAGCRSENQIGGNLEAIVTRLKSFYDKQLKLYFTSLGESDFKTAADIVEQLSSIGISTDNSGLSHNPGKYLKDLERILNLPNTTFSSMEMSQSEWQDGYRQDAKDIASLGILPKASLRVMRNGAISGTPFNINGTGLEQNLPEYLTEISGGVEPATIILRSNQTKNGRNLTRSTILAREDLIRTNPDLVAPKKAYPELRDNIGLEGQNINNFGELVETF